MLHSRPVAIRIVLAGLLAALVLTGCIASISPASANRTVGTVHTVTVNVDQHSVNGPYPTPVPWTAVFTVTSGPNIGRTSKTLDDCSPSCSGNGVGTVKWAYTGTGGPGTDQIFVCINHTPIGEESGSSCSSVAVTWLQSPSIDSDLDDVCNPYVTAIGCTGSDKCPNTPSAEKAGVDADGCSQSQVDKDLDGVCDRGVTSGLCTGSDSCPNTPSAERGDVDANGCSRSQVDHDLDGVCDRGVTSSLCTGSDSCPNTTTADRGRVDATGCVSSKTPTRSS